MPVNLPPPPKWKWEWNPNTIVSLAGFLIMVIGGFIAWGYVVAEFRTGLGAHTSELERIDKRVTALEASSRMLDNHELRITNVEKQATDAAAAMRAIESAIGSLSTDIRVVREILQRLEERDRRPP